MNNQLPADVQARIMADADEAHKEVLKNSSSNYSYGYRQGYKDGAMAENISFEPIIKAAEKVGNLFAHKGDHQTCAICELARALQQWKEGKEVGDGV